MTITLTQPSIGATGWGGSVNTNFQDIQDAINQGTGFPRGYIERLRMRHGSATTTKVGAGSCRNQGNDANILLAAEATADVTVGHSGSNGLAQLNGLDEKGLDNLVSSPITCSQTGTAITASADVTPHLRTRSGAGTITSSGTTVTGSGTSFLSEAAVGDLVGTSSTYGWSRVTEIASDTSLTVSDALPGGTIGAGVAFTIIENATVQPASGAKERIRTVSAAGTAIVVTTSTSHAGGSALTIGVEVASAWIAVWVIDDASTPGLLLSTQRTTLLAPPSGYTSARRVGWVRNDSGGDLLEFVQSGSGTRCYSWQNGNFNAIVSNASPATSWTSADVSPWAPPTSRRLQITPLTGPGASPDHFYLRPRGIGSSTTSRPRFLYVDSNSALCGGPSAVHCDGAQWVEYAFAFGNGSLYLDAFGWEEDLQ